MSGLFRVYYVDPTTAEEHDMVFVPEVEVVSDDTGDNLCTLVVCFLDGLTTKIGDVQRHRRVPQCGGRQRKDER